VAEPAPGKSPLQVELRLYDRLFKSEDPSKASNWLDDLNPNSLKVQTAFADPSLAKVRSGEKYQFERVGFFNVDPDTETTGHITFNLTVKLKDKSKSNID